MCNHTFVEKNIPEGHRVTVQHFHAGNSSKKFRQGKPYMTVAIIFDNDGKLIGKGRALCNESECPRRGVGRAVAIGRAMAKAYGSRNLLALVETVA